MKTVEVLLPASRRHRELNTLEDVKRTMARACRMIEGRTIKGQFQQMGHEQGRAWVYSLRCLSQLMQEMDTERRLADLEEELMKLKMAKANPVPKKELVPA